MRMKRTGKIVITLVTALLLVLTAACVPPKEVTPPPTLISPAGMGIIKFYVTDPPRPNFTSIEIFIDSIEVHKVVPGEPGEWITISDNISSFDLMDVVGVTQLLASANTTAGKFTQIRIGVNQVLVTTDNVTTDNATLPSGTLRIVRPFEVREGLITALTLDFDGNRSVVTTGRGKFIFKPVVHLLVEHSSPPVTSGDTTPPVITLTDTTPPTITLTGVVEGLVIVSPNTVTPVFTVSDEDPAPTVVATLNGDEFTSGTEVSEVGEYELIVTAIDASGNEAEVAVNFEITEAEDTTPPEITLTGVTEGQVIVSPDTVTPVFTVSDEDSAPIVVATLNGDEFTSGTEVSEVGEYELIVTAIDASGNEAEVAVNFEITAE